MNNISLIGRLVIDPVRTSEKVVKTRLAVNREFKNAKGEIETDFIDLVAFNNTANYLQSYAKKGDLIGVVGSLRQDTWNDDSGKNHTTYSVAVERAAILSSKEQPKPTPQPTPKFDDMELPF